MPPHTPDDCPLSARITRLEKRKQNHKRIGELIFDSDFIGTRLTLAVAELIWAITLLCPGDSLSNPAYSWMKSIAAEEVWGLVFLLTAWAQWSLLLIGDFTCHPTRVFAGWNAVLWVVIAAGSFPPPTTISVEIALALSAVWIWVNPWVLTLTNKWMQHSSKYGRRARDDG